MSQIRLLVADDQVLVRDALSALLDLEADLTVVARVGRGDEVVAAALEHAPDVCLLDLEMPGLDGVEATAAVRAACPGARVLIVTTFGRPGYLRRALDAGAAGFVVKDIPAGELVDAVRRVHAGLRVVDPTLATESLLGGASPLTERETEVLRLVAKGLSAKQIARRLDLSHRTVENHVQATLRKLQLGNRVELTRYVIEHGLDAD